MSIENERVEHFAVWRNARRNYDYDLCENCIKDLLTTLTEHSELKVLMIDKYNNYLKNFIRDLEIIKMQYEKDKRLTKGVEASRTQEERQRQFYDELYDVFYHFFVTNSLFPSYLAEGGN